jgi:hypothetical protein
MKKDKQPLSRRDFIKSSASTAMLATVTAGCQTSKTANAAGKSNKKVRKKKSRPSKVVLIRDKNVLDAKGKPIAAIVAKMIDQALCSLLNKKTPNSAWKSLLKPSDRLGIKSNVWSYLPTPPAVENVVKQRARSVGIPAKQIWVDDRGAKDNLAKCTALINTRPLRSHHWAGIGGCLKNYIMFVDKPWTYHPDSCIDLGALWNLPIVAGKTRLNILVLLTPLYHGRGPHHFNAKYLWPYRGLLLSTDPVAADRIGVEILKAKRKQVFGRHRPFASHTKHIEMAERKHHIGNSNLKRIHLVRLGDKDDILI